MIEESSRIIRVKRHISAGDGDYHEGLQGSRSDFLWWVMGVDIQVILVMDVDIWEDLHFK